MQCSATRSWTHQSPSLSWLCTGSSFTAKILSSVFSHVAVLVNVFPTESAALLGSKETLFFYSNHTNVFHTHLWGKHNSSLGTPLLADLHWPSCSCLSLQRHSSSMELAFLCLHRASEQRQNTDYLVPAVNHKQATAILQVHASATAVTSDLPTVPIPRKDIAILQPCARD